MKILAIIPARGGSKGLPGKNLRPLAGKPLLVWTVEQASASGSIDRVVVSTDCPKIAEVAREAGADVPVLRPAHLAKDDTPTEPALLHMLDVLEHESYRPDAVMLLQRTSPVRRQDSLDRAVRRFLDTGADSLVGVVESHAFFWSLPDGPEAAPRAQYDYRNRARRQEIPGDQHLFRENGSIYITRIETLRSEGNRLGGRIVLFEMDATEGFEVDSAVDFAVVETMMRLA